MADHALWLASWWVNVWPGTSGWGLDGNHYEVAMVINEVLTLRCVRLPEARGEGAQIVVSCQRRGIDPLDYIRDVLTRLPTMANRDDLTPLLPAHWKAAVS